MHADETTFITRQQHISQSKVTGTVVTDISITFIAPCLSRQFSIPLCPDYRQIISTKHRWKETKVVSRARQLFGSTYQLACRNGVGNRLPLKLWNIALLHSMDVRSRHECCESASMKGRAENSGQTPTWWVTLSCSLHSKMFLIRRKMRGLAWGLLIILNLQMNFLGTSFDVLW